MMHAHFLIVPIKLQVLVLCIPACGAGRLAFSCTIHAIGSLQTHTKRIMILKLNQVHHL